MAVTYEILQMLFSGGKGPDEALLLAKAMERGPDAKQIFEEVALLKSVGLSAERCAEVLCWLAEDIINDNEQYGAFSRNPFEPKFYVYHHIGIASGEVFYVGKGCNDRANSKRSRSRLWRDRQRVEGGFTAVIVKDGLTEPEALEFERSEIQRLNALVRLENLSGVNL